MRRLLPAMLLLVLLGCAQPGAKFIGHWQSTKNPKDTFEIVKNGDGFLFVANQRDWLTGKTEETKAPATLADGVLRVEIGMGVNTAVAYVEASDTLSGQGPVGPVEYKRVK